MIIVFSLSNYPLSYLVQPGWPYNSLAGSLCGGRGVKGAGTQAARAHLSLWVGVVLCTIAQAVLHLRVKHYLSRAGILSVFLSRYRRNFRR